MHDEAERGAVHGVELNVQHLVLLGILASTVHWLVARSKIAEPLWSRATGHFDALLRCAGCSGFWLGLLLGTAGVLPVTGWSKIACVAAAGALGAFVTPVFEAILLWGLEQSAVEDDQ